MTNMELKALEVIWDWGGEAGVDTVARELRVSLEYARLICNSLGESEYLNMTRSGGCKLKGKGKLEAAKHKVSKPKKIVAAPLREGREKKRRLILRY